MRANASGKHLKPSIVCRTATADKAVSCIVVPAGKNCMHDEKTVQRFIELRASGWIYARLMTELNVSKTTIRFRTGKGDPVGLPPRHAILVKKR
jgi:hypothetical protein